MSVVASIARLCLALLVPLTVAAGSATAQEWPAKPVKLVVPFPPGGATDIAGRVVADYLTKSLKQTFVVENRAGAAGNIGNEFVAKAAPDGYTFVVSTDSLSSGPAVYKLTFDPLKDLVPVIQLSRQPMVLAVNPSLGVKTLAELVALAKTKPGLAYGHSGIGTNQHFSGEWFTKLAGIKLTHVPYKGGAPAIADFVSGQVPLALLGSSPLMPHYKSGKAILLAQTTKARAPTLPDIPTFQQAGFPDLWLDQWLGVAAPRGTPPAIIEALNKAIGKALTDPAVLERYSQAGLEAVGGSVAQFAALIAEDAARYAQLAKELGIKAD